VVGGLDRHQIANIALDEVWWGISIGPDATTERRQNQKSPVSVVLEDNASGKQKKSVLDGRPPVHRWKKDDTISRRREVRGGMSEWRTS
jgi:hypothetical protein